MNDRYQIFRLLGAEPRGLLLTGLTVDWWQSTVTVGGLYDPDRSLPFWLTFTQVRSVACTMLDEDQFQPDMSADVIFWLIGEGNYEAKAFIHTDLFDIEISYGAVEVIKPLRSDE
jgi:hypothetical protein